MIEAGVNDRAAVAADPRSLPRSQSDAVARAGEQQGAFAWAARDETSGRAFGAVDRFGIETLCWRDDGASLAFAPRATELVRGEPELDLQSLYDYLYFHGIPAPRTAFVGVHRLPAAHCVWRDADAQAARTARYWTPRFASARASRSALPDLAQRFRDLLLQAVRDELDGSKPACFLSGGTDSSTVAGMIREASGQGAEAFSIGFDAEGYDEMAYARLAAQRFGCRHHEYYVTPDDLVRGIPEMAAAFDQPFGNSSVLPAYYCARVAREAGVAKLLAGDGGDELFGGNARYATQKVFGWYGRVPRWLRRGLLEPVLFSGLGGALAPRLPPVRRARSYIEQARTPMPERGQGYNLLLRLGPAEVLTPEFLGAVDPGAPLKQQQAVWDAVPDASELDQTLAYDWRYTLAESDLPKVREATRLAGVAVGYPMLHPALVEFSLGLPDEYKLKGLQLRWFFKEALRGFLPDEIITKPKHGFGLPFGPWLLRHAGLRRLAEDSVRSLAARRLVRADFVRDLLEVRLAQHPGYYGEMVWILMMLEQWLAHHAPRWRI